LVVAACRTCGESNAETARFCHACGGALDGAELAAPREVRKTVTVLFADVAGSTALGEQLDPEALRGVMSRYFDEMRGVLEHHGGTVEKFIGDAVMAVFGAPVAHEDDALRAVRAADEMQERLGDLNRDFESRHGIQLEMRIGVNTGEVVAGDPAAGQAIVTGDSVNLAKRLEQAAPPGGILIGKTTYPLVKDAIRAGPLESFPVKGKSAPVAPFRLEAIDRDAVGVARRLDRPLVGREAELAALEVALRRTEATGECRLFTILGPPGIGKSRLIAEFVERAAERTAVLTGRCLPYGHGITFWPLREIVRALGGKSGLEVAVAGAEDADLIVQGVLGAVGESEPSSGTVGAELGWAFRRVLETLAQNRPVVLVLEDIHSAAPTFLDLIEYLHGWSRGPILIVCLARTELLERHASWVAPRPEADSLALAPLSSEDAAALLAGLPDSVQATAETRRAIAEAAEGNPLFLEQMAAMLAEEGPSSARPVPPSIQALLAERLDQLTAEERAAIERAAVIGREFWAGAVADLSPAGAAEETVRPALMALVRKKLIDPDVSAFAREDAFRFQHQLIRDAAYETISKRLRAELHERFAAWLEGRTAEGGVELDEIIGYHLEQAHHYLNEIESGERAAHLGAAAGARLSSAGRRALARGDPPAAVSLLQRAVALLDEKAALEFLSDLGRALYTAGQLKEADDLLERAARKAAARGDEIAEASALIERAEVRMHAHAEVGEIDAAAERAIAIFKRHGDNRGLARAWWLMGTRDFVRGQFAAADQALQDAVAYARAAGDGREERRSLVRLTTCLVLGPTPVRDALSRCSSLHDRLASDRGLQAMAQAATAELVAMQGDFAEARRRYSDSKEVLLDVGNKVYAAGVALYAGPIELLSGDAHAALAELRAAYELLEEIGETGTRSSVAAVLARAAHAASDFEEAVRFADLSASISSPHDVLTLVIATGTKAKALADLGRQEEAEELATTARALADTGDFLVIRGDALLDFAYVFRSADAKAQRLAAAEEAAALYERKGNEPSLARARAVIEREEEELDSSPQVLRNSIYRDSREVR
jgi:class 3 adenylate cyclase/tetratricopeptide (TPR) repeat protein